MPAGGCFDFPQETDSMEKQILVDLGEPVYALAQRLWPINRSLTGDGVRRTLHILKELLPELSVQETPSGKQVFDWVIPDEWNVREAWVENDAGQRVVDFSTNNLHLVGYSIPTDVTLQLEELQQHLHSIPEQPDAVPYVTSYYSPYWGFCMRHEDRMRLQSGSYHVHIDATLAPGSLTYGELVIPGQVEEEVFLSTYICHPSMANNELSGPCVTTCLAKWLNELPRRFYTYRIVFVPETIGSIAYLSQHLEHLKKKVIAGFNITCIGDDRVYSYLPSRAGDTFSDRAAKHVLQHLSPGFIEYSYLDRGSDERQYCAPGVDLPIATIMRSKYGEYPEYHTSLDDMSLISPAGLGGGLNALQKAIETIEAGASVPRVSVLCEPQLGKRGLYPSISKRDSSVDTATMMNLIAYSDGHNSLLEIAEIIGEPVWELLPLCRKLSMHGLLEDIKGIF